MGSFPTETELTASPPDINAVDSPLMIGQRLGHYRVISKIGVGGMGVVYRAHDEQLDRDGFAEKRFTSVNDLGRRLKPDPRVQPWDRIGGQWQPVPLTSSLLLQRCLNSQV